MWVFVIFGYIGFLSHVMYFLFMHFHILSYVFLVKRLEVFRKALYKCCFIIIIIILF